MGQNGPTTVRLVIIVEVAMAVALLAYAVYLIHNARDYSADIAHKTPDELRAYLADLNANIGTSQRSVDRLVDRLINSRQSAMPDLMRMLAAGPSLSLATKVAAARGLLGPGLSPDTLASLVDKTDLYVNGESTL